jgi:hypothetical protein
VAVTSPAGPPSGRSDGLGRARTGWPAGRILVMMRNQRAPWTRRPVPGSPFNTPRPPPQPVEQFAADDLVTHDRYGLGRVISTEADAVLVDFGAERYRITAPYGKLTKL